MLSPGGPRPASSLLPSPTQSAAISIPASPMRRRDGADDLARSAGSAVAALPSHFPYGLPGAAPDNTGDGHRLTSPRATSAYYPPPSASASSAHYAANYPASASSSPGRFQPPLTPLTPLKGAGKGSGGFENQLNGDGGNGGNGGVAVPKQGSNQSFGFSRRPSSQNSSNQSITISNNNNNNNNNNNGSTLPSPFKRNSMSEAEDNAAFPEVGFFFFLKKKDFFNWCCVCMCVARRKYCLFVCLVFVFICVLIFCFVLFFGSWGHQ